MLEVIIIVLENNCTGERLENTRNVLKDDVEAC